MTQQRPISEVQSGGRNHSKYFKSKCFIERTGGYQKAEEVKTKHQGIMVVRGGCPRS